MNDIYGGERLHDRHRRQKPRQTMRRLEEARGERITERMAQEEKVKESRGRGREGGQTRAKKYEAAALTLSNQMIHERKITQKKKQIPRCGDRFEEAKGRATTTTNGKRNNQWKADKESPKGRNERAGSLERRRRGGERYGDTAEHSRKVPLPVWALRQRVVSRITSDHFSFPCWLVGDIFADIFVRVFVFFRSRTVFRESDKTS